MLQHYLSVREHQRPPRFMQARALAIPAAGNDWAVHRSAVARLHTPPEARAGTPPPYSLLDLKIDLATRALSHCDLCPHHCGIDRNRGETGYCGVGADTAVHWEGILHGEELEVTPSHEVFLSGCTMRCAFCYSHRHITNAMSGQFISPAELARLADARHREGAVNLNLVGGEPTVHLANILRALRVLEQPVPVVWNSNMYATEVAMELLDGVVDLFLGDIHFGNDTCARKLGRIPNYLPSVQAAFHHAARSGAGVIIRHLLMPGHVECCARPAMEWAAAELPDVPFHLMFQYVPDFRAAGDPVLGRPISPAERAAALRIAAEVGVNLYREPAAVPARPLSRHGVADNPGIGETVDILIRGDGQVTFTRLLEQLLPVAGALHPDEARVASRLPSRAADPVDLEVPA